MNLAEQVLAAPMDPARNDASATTIRGYLTRLLGQLWRQQELFSGKRPFGNSSWEIDLYIALVKADLISGRFDEHGYLDEVDGKAGDALIDWAITSLGVPQ
jgi:hypothetical protein